MTMSGPSTTTDLANLALDLIEQNNTLLDVESDTTAAGKAVRRNFWHCWDEVLRAAPWNCARKRVGIAALSEEPEWGFDFYYQLPADYVNMQEIDGLVEGEKWVRETTPAGADAIAIDLEAPLNIAYTYLLRDIARADPLFRSAFVARLGAAICAPLAKSGQVEAKCWRIYEKLIGEAQGADSREGSRTSPRDSMIVSIRD